MLDARRGKHLIEIVVLVKKAMKPVLHWKTLSKSIKIPASEFASKERRRLDQRDIKTPAGKFKRGADSRQTAANDHHFF